jgi:transcriptional regulator with XRE-family HTH domain
MRNEASKLGKNLKRIRVAKGITQGDIVRKLKVGRGFISNIENGKANPTLSTIAKLAEAIKVPIDKLLK